jgi:uncharacterized protein YcfL
MRKLAISLALVLLAGCSRHQAPTGDVTHNPVWGPQVKALRETEDVAKFAEEQQRINDKSLKNLGLAPDQIKEGH